MPSKPKDPLVGLHVKIPQAVLDRLLQRRDEMRKKDPMATLSTAIRSAIERGLKALEKKEK